MASFQDYQEAEFSRGHTLVGQNGYVAWIDSVTRKVHVAKGRCTSQGHTIRVMLDDGDTELCVPNGRLDWSPAAALDSLAIDIRAEGERDMQPIQEQLNAIARRMLLDLIAIEMAKQQAGATDVGHLIVQRPDRLSGDGPAKLEDHRP